VRDRLGVALERAEHLGRLEVKDLHRLVRAASHDDVPVRGEVERGDPRGLGGVERWDVVDLRVRLDLLGGGVTSSGLALLPHGRKSESCVSGSSRGASMSGKAIMGQLQEAAFTHAALVSLINWVTSAGRAPTSSIVSSAGCSAAASAGAGANPIVF
jgi:hypothetical protein